MSLAHARIAPLLNYSIMKYFVANFKIECEAELMQPARELLSAAACEAGFEAACRQRIGFQYRLLNVLWVIADPFQVPLLWQ
jgi:hypothetical protein